MVVDLCVFGQYLMHKLFGHSNNIVRRICYAERAVMGICGQHGV